MASPDASLARPVWRDPVLLLALALFVAGVWLMILDGFKWRDLSMPLISGFMVAFLLERRATTHAAQRGWRLVKFAGLIGATAVLIAKWALLDARWP